MLSKHIFMVQTNALRLDRGETLPIELIVVHRGMKWHHTGDSGGSSLIVQPQESL